MMRKKKRQVLAAGNKDKITGNKGSSKLHLECISSVDGPTATTTTIPPHRYLPNELRTTRNKS
jgi:hypothetical protein